LKEISMNPSPRRKVALRKITSLVSLAAFAAVVVGGFLLRPAYADDQSRAVAACRDSVVQRVEGMTPASLGLGRVGGGGKRFKVWLAASPNGGTDARQFYCVVKRSGAVEEVTALNADGSTGQSLLAAR